MESDQVTSGIWSLLSNSYCYQLIQDLIGATRGRRIFIEEYVHPQCGDHLLDIGCGPASILNFLRAVEYVGVDASPAYIQSAKKNFGSRGTFLCSDVNGMNLESFNPFDIAIAAGVLHHLSDTEGAQIFEKAYQSLRPGGRLLTFDPIYAPDQNAICRWLIRNDRGKHIRDAVQLTALSQKYFGRTNLFIRHDLFHVPYSIVILECFR